jgi:hypothetical protein
MGWVEVKTQVPHLLLNVFLENTGALKTLNNLRLRHVRSVSDLDLGSLPPQNMALTKIPKQLASEWSQAFAVRV